MDHAVSQKGTKTKARAATHSPLLASGVRCVSCCSWRVLRTVSANGKRAGTHWCGTCGHFFTVGAV